MRATFLGPVLYYDLLRTARRARYTVVRTLYALGLLCLFALMYAESPGLGSGQVQAQDMSRFATNFFYAFLIFQYVLAVLLTPAYVAGAIAEEKERRTLEFIMATDLRSREIVLSKLCSRVANLLMLLLAGLPVLSFIQLFGGVDPALLWSGFTATGMTVLSIASVSILLSVYMSKARPAIVRSFMLVVLYIILYLLFLYFLGMLFYAYAIPAVGGAPMERPDIMNVLGWAFELYGAGHPIHAVVSFFDGGGSPFIRLTGIRLASSPMGVLRNYCIFHGLIVLLCVALSIWRLRPVFLRQAFAVAKTAGGKRGKAAPRRRPVGNAPMMWKELVIEGGRTTWPARILFALIAVASLAPVGMIFYFDWFGPAQGFRSDLSENIMIYAMIVGPTVAMMLVLGIGSRAAGSVGSERDRQTLESLLTTPLRLSEILAAKWVGAWWGARPVLALLAVIWVVSTLSGGMTLEALVLVVLSVIVYGCQSASLGLLFGAWSRTTLRATVATAGTQIFLMGGYWFGCGPAISLFRDDKMAAFMLGFTPPAVIGMLTSVGGKHTYFRDSREAAIMVLGIIVGLGFAVASAFVFWLAALAA